METSVRDDLEFLYAKAMRSTDLEFINEVSVLLSIANWEEMVDDLIERASSLELMKYFSDFDGKMDFLIGDSQMGRNWYRTK